MKKIVSLLLVVCLLLNILPVKAAYAQETETEEVKYSTDGGETWKEASFIDAIYECYDVDIAEIILQKDIVLQKTDATSTTNWSEGVVLAGANKKLTIDGNGYTVTRGNGITKLFSVNAEGSEVIFKNITIDGGAIWSEGDVATRTNSGITAAGNAHLIAIDRNATVILEDGTILQNSALEGSSADGAAVFVGETETESTLIIKQGVEIRDNYVKDSGGVGGSGAAIYIKYGNLIMEGGEIYNNYAAVGGGAITMSENGKFIMNDGIIHDNYAGNNGGGVCVNGNGQFTMSGGSITENKAAGAGGGGVTIMSKGTFTMSDGSITKNNGGTRYGGGGVLIVAGTCNFEGTPVIWNNTVGTDEKIENVKLAKDSLLISISGPLLEGTKVGITSSAGEDDFSSGWSDYMEEDARPKDYFTSDDSTYGVSKNTVSGEVKLCEHNYGEYTPDNNATCEDNSTETAVCSKCNDEDSRVIPNTATGHKYGSPDFIWQEDGKSCSAIFTCENDESHVKELDMEITSEVTRPAGTTTKGETTYTAKVEFEGTIYEDTKAIDDIPMVKPGTIDKEVYKDDNAPDTRFDMTTDDIADILLTDAEKEEIENGKDIKIILSVEDAKDSVSEDDKASIDTVRKNFLVGQYLDISLSKIIGDRTEPIYETKEKIRITINIPEVLKNNNSDVKREFLVVRVHNGEAEILQDVDSNDDTITIETDKFSTYSLMYRDTTEDEDTEPPTEEPTTVTPSEPTVTPSEPTGTPSEPTGTPSEPTTGTPSEPTTGTPSEPAAGTPSEPTTGTPSEPTTGSPSEPTGNQNAKPTDKVQGSTDGGKTQTGDITPVEIYATAAMIAGFTYLLLFGSDEHGMTEEDKKKLIDRIIRWARKGGRIRKALAFPIIVIVLAYYHSIGKKSSVQGVKISL